MAPLYLVNPFKVDGDPVIVAAERSGRPHTSVPHEPVDRQQALRPYEPDCPFCPGNEARTPPEVLADRPGGSRPDGPGWRVRVVPNLYPALAAPPGGVAPAGEIVFAPDELYDTAPAEGLHEVAIHSPDHSGRLSTLGQDALTLAVEAWQDRLASHSAAGWSATTITVNEGREAGASLAHPHAQLFATGLVPPALEREVWVQDRYGERLGRRLLDDVVAAELKARERIVDTEGALVAWVPPWAEVPFETWLAPREADSDTGRLLDSPHAGELAGILGRVTRLIAAAADDPALNVVVRDPPHVGSRWTRWHVRIVPRTSIAAGFELATGMRIVTMQPEDAAAALRLHV